MRQVSAALPVNTPLAELCQGSTVQSLTFSTHPVPPAWAKKMITDYAAAFFAVEVRRLIIEEQLMLHALDKQLRNTGTWGAEYMAHRLLHTKLPVLARWDMVRHIAARLAHDEEESKKTYPLYVHKLCVRAAQEMTLSLAFCCSAEPDPYSTKLCGGFYCDYDLVAAAAYLDKTAVIDHVANNAHTLRTALGLFGTPIMSAVSGDNLEAMQLLFRKVALVSGEAEANNLRHRLLGRMSVQGSTSIVQASLPNFVPERYEDIGGNERSPVMKILDDALRTPNVKTFKLLMQIKENTPHPEVEKRDWQMLLVHACFYGSADMIQHLFTLGAQYSYKLTDIRENTLKFLIRDVIRQCERDRIIRTLLSYGAPVTSDAVVIAAKHGNWSLVQILVEAGADINSGKPKPLVSAISLERTDMFKALIEWGARLDSEVMEACAKRAREEGLKSMLDLLQ
jgi:hypothetical protein